MLLDHGGLDIDHLTGEQDLEYPGSTALMLAAAGGHVEAVKLLLGRGADVNKADNDGFTPFWEASGGGHVEVLKILLDCGVDVNEVNNDGETPLHAAAEKGAVAAIKLLLGRGADTSKADNAGKTPVYTASENGKAEAAHVLLKAGADARVANNEGSTALHMLARPQCSDVAERDHLDAVRVLAERWPTNPLAWRMFLMGGGAASELQDYLAPPPNQATRNHLPRLYSKPDMMKEVYKYLHKPRYADLDQKDGEGRTAAQVATSFGKDDMFRDQRKGHEDVATLLRELGLG
jgi:ankyrin repeat protein